LDGRSFLAARVATHLLIGCSYNLFCKKAINRFSSEIVGEILNHLSLEIVIEAYRQKMKKNQNPAIGLVLDDVNLVYEIELSQKTRQFTKEMAMEIGEFMRPSSIVEGRTVFLGPKALLLPVICGFTMDGIDEAMKISGGFSQYTPEISLLKKESIIECYDKYCRNNNQALLQTTIPRNQLDKILQYFGTIPRGLEFVIAMLNNFEHSVSGLNEDVHSMMTSWFSVNRFFPCNSRLNFSQLQVNKYLKAFRGDKEAAKLYLLMCLVGQSTKAALLPKAIHTIDQASQAGLYYIFNDKLYFCASILKGLNKHFKLIDDDLLLLPCGPFYWQHFERLVAQFEVWHNCMVAYPCD